jgi:SNF2 family DNA or RNA helicase
MMTFSTTTELLAHQEIATAKLLRSRVGALFMDMGTGKTRTALELARIRQAKWDRLIWFCPVSLKETIRYEIAKHTDISADIVYVFDSKTDDVRVPLDRLIYIIGIESMASSTRVVLAANKLITDQSYVIVDESSYIKGNRAIRTQRITGISKRSKYRTILTGTPFSQGVVDLYAQMTFLSPKILGYNSFYSFAANHLCYEERKDSRGRLKRTGRIISSHNWDYLAEKIAPYTYQVRKSECMSLPDKLYQAARFELTTNQRIAYDQAKEDALERKDPDDWSPIWIFRLFTALQTITCGWWNRQDPITGKRELLQFEHDRVDRMLSVVKDIAPPDKVIVWSKYVPAANEIVEALSGEYGSESVSRFDGTLSEKERAAELERWRESGRFLVATQSSVGHGFTLNEAAYVIFYADSFKYSERIQAEDRNHRYGQSRQVTYISIGSDAKIDNLIDRALANKGHALKMFRQELELVRKSGLKEKAIALVRAL